VSASESAFYSADNEWPHHVLRVSPCPLRVLLMVSEWRLITERPFRRWPLLNPSDRSDRPCALSSVRSTARQVACRAANTPSLPIRRASECWIFSRPRRVLFLFYPLRAARIADRHRVSHREYLWKLVLHFHPDYARRADCRVSRLHVPE